MNQENIISIVIGCVFSGIISFVLAEASFNKSIEAQRDSLKQIDKLIVSRFSDEAIDNYIKNKSGQINIFNRSVTLSQNIRKFKKEQKIIEEYEDNKNKSKIIRDKYYLPYKRIMDDIHDKFNKKIETEYSKIAGDLSECNEIITLEESNNKICQTRYTHNNNKSEFIYIIETMNVVEGEIVTNQRPFILVQCTNRTKKVKNTYQIIIKFNKKYLESGELDEEFMDMKVNNYIQDEISHPGSAHGIKYMISNGFYSSPKYKKLVEEFEYGLDEMKNLCNINFKN